jgi:hypothetical protein
MSSSRDSPSSGGNGDANNNASRNRGASYWSKADNNDDTLPTEVTNSHVNHDEQEPEPWPSSNGPNENELEDGMEERDDEEHQGPDADGDNSSDVSPDILNNISDGEDQERRPNSRRRACKSKSKSTKCVKCEQIKRQWNDEVNELKRKSEATERELNAKIRELEREIERLTARNRITWRVSMNAPLARVGYLVTLTREYLAMEGAPLRSPGWIPWLWSKWRGGVLPRLLSHLPRFMQAG